MHVALAPCRAYRVWALPDALAALHVAAWLCAERRCLASCPHAAAVATLHASAADARACEVLLRARWAVTLGEASDAGVPRALLEASVKFYLLHALRPRDWMRIEAATFVQKRADGLYDAVEVDLAPALMDTWTLSLRGGLRSLPFFQVAAHLTQTEHAAFLAGEIVLVRGIRVRVLPKLTPARILSISRTYSPSEAFATEDALLSYWEHVYGYPRVGSNDGYASVAFECGSFPLTYPLCFLLETNIGAAPTPAIISSAESKGVVARMVTDLKAVQCEDRSLFLSISEVPHEALHPAPTLLRPSELSMNTADLSSPTLHENGPTPQPLKEATPHLSPVSNSAHALPQESTIGTRVLKKPPQQRKAAPSGSENTPSTITSPESARGRLRLPSFKRTPGVKRGLDTRDQIPSSKRARVDEGDMALPHDMADDEVHRMREQGDLARLPLTTLKSYLRKHGEATSGSKTDIVARITRLLAATEE